MEFQFPKKLLAVIEAVPAEGHNAQTHVSSIGVKASFHTAEALVDLPVHLLPDGAEVAIYRLARVKRLEVSRRLVKLDAADPDDEGENETGATAPE